MRGLKKKNLEFISAGSRRNVVRSALRTRRAAFFVVPALILCLFVSMSIGFSFETSALRKETEEIRTQFNQEDAGQVKEHLEALGAANDTFHVMRQELNELMPVFAQLSNTDGNDFRAVYGLKGESLTIQNVDLKDNSLIISAVSEFYREGTYYAVALERSGRFERVSYGGFSEKAEGVDHEGYHFLITVKLRRGSR